MQIEKALIGDRLPVSKASSKFRIRSTDNFAVMLPVNFDFFLKK